MREIERKGGKVKNSVRECTRQSDKERERVVGHDTQVLLNKE